MAGQGKLMLAIDTATEITGVALFDGAVQAEALWRSARNQSAELIPAIQWLLPQAGAVMDDVAAIAVSLGPGSFNGLRVGIATAKGLCTGRGIPCVGVSTLEATAYQYRYVDLPIRPVISAGREEVATALYRVENGGLRTLEQPRLTRPDELAAEIAERTLICGDVPQDWQRRLRERAADKVVFPSSAGMIRRPAYLAEMAWHLWQANKVDDARSLQPVYLRRPAITPPRR